VVFLSFFAFWDLYLPAPLFSLTRETGKKHEKLATKAPRHQGTPRIEVFFFVFLCFLGVLLGP
jgi:hypothetical protein